MLFSHKAVSVIEFWKYDDNFRSNVMFGISKRDQR